MSARVRLRQSRFQSAICRSTHSRGGSGKMILPAVHLSAISSADTSLNRRRSRVRQSPPCAVADRRSGSAANHISVQVSSRYRVTVPTPADPRRSAGGMRRWKNRTGGEVRVPTFGAARRGVERRQSGYRCRTVQDHDGLARLHLLQHPATGGSSSVDGRRLHPGNDRT